MKIIITIFTLLLMKLGLFAQSEFISITGEIIGRESKYVYLRCNNEIYLAKIAGSRFEMNVPKVEDYQLGTLFLWSDSLSIEKAQQMFKNTNQDYRSIAIENLHISIGKVTREAWVKGGKYNLELDQMFICLRNRSYLDFFDKYPNSPVSLTLLRTLIGMAKVVPYFRGELTLKIYFDKLSDDLKEGEQGKKLWAMIAPMYKN